MRLCVNWLPISAELTTALARRVERGGLWGLGVGDSPNYGEVYANCALALAATERITVATSVTNPVTRHISVHASASGTLGATGRFRLGVGRGDSAVRTFGLAPASLTDVESMLARIREEAPDVPRLLAASGPKAAATGGRSADGLIAGVGADRATVDRLRTIAQERRGRPVEVWASLRLAIARDERDAEALRSRMLPRAVGAAHFAFSAGVAGRNVPADLRPILEERFRTYDYRFHGRSSISSNATMFADRPDIEDYLLHRFAVVGTEDECRVRLDEVAGYVDGVYVSLLFEDVLDQVERVAALYADLPAGSEARAPC